MNIAKSLIVSTALIGGLNNQLFSDNVDKNINIDSKNSTEQKKYTDGLNKAEVNDNGQIKQLNNISDTNNEYTAQKDHDISDKQESNVNEQIKQLYNVSRSVRVSNMYVEPATKKMSYGAEGYLNIRLYSGEFDQYLPKQCMLFYQ